MTDKTNPWWSNKGGFFGIRYLEGDDSLEGYIPGKSETLEERTKREVDGVIKLLNLKKEDHILDMPCGYGRHTIELIIRGFRPKGEDINESLVYEAENRLCLEAKKRNPNPNFEPACWGYFGIEDMRHITDNPISLQAQRSGFSPEIYNAIINMFYSFGFFETDEENEKVMKEFFKSLKPNGKLLIHTDVSPEIIKSGAYKFNETRNLKSGKRLIINEAYISENKRMNGSWTLIDKNGFQEQLTPYSVRIYTKEEFEEMAKITGFKETRFYGSFEGEEFSKNSREMIMVARK
ncbi:MAG: class I SAM-dependent methyltransferase [Nanoarchaeota archaeon]